MGLNFPSWIGDKRLANQALYAQNYCSKIIPFTQMKLEAKLIYRGKVTSPHLLQPEGLLECTFNGVLSTQALPTKGSRKQFPFDGDGVLECSVTDVIGDVQKGGIEKHHVVLECSNERDRKHRLISDFFRHQAVLVTVGFKLEGEPTYHAITYKGESLSD